jgi:hypothetical protein
MNTMNDFLNKSMLAGAALALALGGATTAMAGEPCEAVVSVGHLGHVGQFGQMTLVGMAEDEHVDHVIRRVIELNSDDGDESQEIEVKVVDGEVQVTVNGEVIPIDRIQREDGHIVILDADGKPLDDVQIGVGAVPGRVRELWIGDNAPFGRAMIDVEEFEEPAVMLGINLGEPGPALQRHLGLEPGTTTIINGLYKDLPAHAAGLDQFDIIASIDGKQPANPAALRQAMAEKQPGDGVRFGVIHEGRPREVVVKLTAFDRAAMDAAEMIGQPTRMDFTFEALPGARGGLKFFSDDQLRGGLFFDDKQNMFHQFPGRMQLRVEGEGDGEGTLEVEGEELDERLGTLDERLEDLEKMLNELLERAMRDR